MIRALLILAVATAPAFAADPPPDGKAAPAPTAKVSASGIMGRKVLGPDGREIGRVVDVLVDAGSNPRAAVIDFGGFLGVGSRRIAVNWSDLTFPPTGGEADIKLDLTAEQIQAAPAYTDQTKPASVVEPPPLKPAAPPPPAGH
jgi:sporulation protein YlmC with PRC-barrel domain